MYIDENDYRIAIDEREQAIISRYPDEWQRAEAVACEIAAGYLRTRYNVDEAYSKLGEERNPRLVQAIIHIALYQMVHRLPQNMGYERWKDRYDESIAWLENVQAGKTSPALPLLSDPNTGEAQPNGALRFGSIEKSTYHY
nr:MAG TPA: head to tail adaptor [Bacteriophage sp.]DAR49857.1 MAG TPA: head to tail adaptor [Caudoviricetes sp.]